MEDNVKRQTSTKNKSDVFYNRNGSGKFSEKSKLSAKSFTKPIKLSTISTLAHNTTYSNEVPNPFKFNEDIDIFSMRDEERKARLEERVRQRNLKVYEKNYGVEIKSKRLQMALLNDSDDDFELLKKDQRIALRDDSELVVATIKDRPIEKETLTEYINKKREMFQIQYSLGVKREEMRKLNEISITEEKKLELAEQYLDEDIAMFDAFLKENDKNSADAMKVAENAGKERMIKVLEAKALTAQLLQIKAEINKYEEQLKEYRLYKEFLDRLIPEDVQNERKSKSNAKKKTIIINRKDDEVSVKTSRENSDVNGQNNRKKSLTKKVQELPAARRDSSGEQDLQLNDYSSDDSDLDFYFKDPQELLNLFMELEESNLSLIQTCQETEESLEELKEIKTAIEMKMKVDTDILNRQIEQLDMSIALEQMKLEEFEIRKQMFTHHDVTAENQDSKLEIIHAKVETVYKSCFKDREAKMSTLDMLTSIENLLDELFWEIDQLPTEKVEIAQKAKEKERRLQIREEKKEQQRLHQEENKQKALERAKAAPRKQLGRRIIARSEPPFVQKEDGNLNDQKSREEEEYNYFFT